MKNPFPHFNSLPEVIPPCDNNVPPISALAAERRGPPRRAWNRHSPQDDVAVMEQIWPMSADEIRKTDQSHAAYTRWKRHLDDIYMKISGELHYFLRAVTREREVPESFASKSRDLSVEIRTRSGAWQHSPKGNFCGLNISSPVLDLPGVWNIFREILRG
jgi:hypothetical protein